MYLCWTYVYEDESKNYGLLKYLLPSGTDEKVKHSKKLFQLEEAENFQGCRGLLNRVHPSTAACWLPTSLPVSHMIISTFLRIHAPKESHAEFQDRRR